jgi:hypothetical protein
VKPAGGGIGISSTKAKPAGTNGFGDGIAILDRTSIIGDGPGKTILQIRGPGNYAYFFWIHDASNVSMALLRIGMQSEQKGSI